MQGDGSLAAQPKQKIDKAELIYLIVQTLSQSPLQQIGRLLAQQASEEGLLPCRYSYDGEKQHLTLEELQQRYSYIPATGLQLALSNLLHYKQEEQPYPEKTGLTSLLDAQILGALRQPDTCLLKLKASAEEALLCPPPPSWCSTFHNREQQGLKPSNVHRMLIREIGASQSIRQHRTLFPGPELAKTMQYQKTLRGHRSAVYCVIFDRTGSYIVTGSDDRLVKIWSAKTGMLQRSCRGHDGEITDLSISCDNSCVASASMDTTIRVWQLQGNGRMGAQVSVLVGHSDPVTYVDFSPELPSALLSSSFDGTCRIWNACNTAIPPIVLRVDPLQFGVSCTGMTRSLNQLLRDPTSTVGQARHSERRAAGSHSAAAEPQFVAHATEQQHETDSGDADDQQHVHGNQDQFQLLVCSFSRDGTHIVAGSNDCNIYVWRWLAAKHTLSPHQIQAQQQHAPQISHSIADIDRQGTCCSSEVATKDSAAVPSLGPGDAGRAEAGARQATRGQGAGGSEPAERPADSPKQIHQVETSGAGPRSFAPCDGALACKEDDKEWPEPQEVVKLTGHRNDVILLYFNNRGDRLATGSKDGTVRVWKYVQHGRRRVSNWVAEHVIACPPDEEAVRRARQRRRAPPAPAIDQLSWTCDDRKLVVSVTDHTVRVFDAASGELLHRMREHSEAVHVLECHPTNPRLAVSASYDGQLVFWDVVCGRILRKLSSKDSRPDGRDWPDPIPFTDGHFSPDGISFAVTDVAGQLHYYSAGSDSAWLERGAYDQFLSTDYNQLIQDANFNVIDAETQLPAHVLTGRELLCDVLGNAYPLPFQEAWRARRLLAVSPQDASTAEEGKQPGYLLASPLITAAAWHAAESGASENGVLLAVARAQERLSQHEDALDRREHLALGRRAEGVWEGDMTEVEGGAAAGRQSPHPRPRVQYLLTSSDDEDGDRDVERRRQRRHEEDAVRHSARLAGRRQGSSTVLDGHLSAHDLHGEGADHEVLVARQRQDREARLERRRQLQERDMQQRRRKRQRQAAARRESEGNEAHCGSLEGSEVERDGVEGQQDWENWGALEGDEDSSDEEYMSELEDEEDEDEGDRPGPSSRPSARHRKRKARDSRSRVRGQDGSSRRKHRRLERSRRGAGSGRDPATYSWLQSNLHEPGIYVPQMGDEVVYLRQGHEQYLQNTNDKRQPPWQEMVRGRSMRHAEPCRVVGVDYVISDDGNDYTLARLALLLVDPSSPLQGRSFTVDIPPPSAGHPEFVVHRTRFDEAVKRCWEAGDQCKMYWTNEEDDSGEWWVGTVSVDNRVGAAAEVLEDIYGCGGLWERFTVHWQGVATPQGAVVPSEDMDPESRHSPWELFELGTTVQDARSEAPCLEDAAASRVLAAAAAAAVSEQYDLFSATPEWHEAYQSKNFRREFYNRLVALPLSLFEISARLRSGYYHQQEALARDIQLLVQNAATYNGEDSELSEVAQALVDFLLGALEEAPQPPPPPQQQDMPEERASEGGEGVGGGAGVAAVERSDQGEGGDGDVAVPRRPRTATVRAPRLPPGIAVGASAASDDHSAERQNAGAAAQGRPALRVRLRVPSSAGAHSAAGVARPSREARGLPVAHTTADPTRDRSDGQVAGEPRGGGAPGAGNRQAGMYTLRARRAPSAAQQALAPTWGGVFGSREAVGDSGRSLRRTARRAAGRAGYGAEDSGEEAGLSDEPESWRGRPVRQSRRSKGRRRRYGTGSEDEEDHGAGHDSSC